MRTKYAWTMSVIFVAAAAVFAFAWAWTGDERWGRSMFLLPFTLLLAHFVFRPLTLLIIRSGK